MKKGFTLIELMVVISIIALLSSIVLATLQTTKVEAEDVARTETAHSVANALELYYSTNGHYPISLCSSQSNCGTTISALTAAGSGSLSPYIGPVPASLTVSGATNQATYVSDSVGNGYEILYPTQTGRYSTTAGCNSNDVTNFANAAGCIGVNASNVTWIGNSSVPVVTLIISPTNVFSSMNNGVTAVLTFNSSGASSCAFSEVGDGVGMFMGYVGNLYETSGTMSDVFNDIPGNDNSGTVVVTCYTGPNLTGTSASASVTITVDQSQSDEGSAPTVTVAIDPSTYSISGGGPAPVLTWSATGVSNDTYPCVINDDEDDYYFLQKDQSTNVESSGSLTNMPILLSSGDYITVTITCYAGSGQTGASGSGTATLTVTD
jgi:prepilin-type N-terminal cleavage/methylation domain-containing protein